jgi:hypothetical protein
MKNKDGGMSRLRDHWPDQHVGIAERGLSDAMFSFYATNRKKGKESGLHPE